MISIMWLKLKGIQLSLIICQDSQQWFLSQDFVDSPANEAQLCQSRLSDCEFKSLDVPDHFQKPFTLFFRPVFDPWLCFLFIFVAPQKTGSRFELHCLRLPTCLRTTSACFGLLLLDFKKKKDKEVEKKEKERFGIVFDPDPDLLILALALSGNISRKGSSCQDNKTTEH